MVPRNTNNSSFRGGHLRDSLRVTRRRPKRGGSEKKQKRLQRRLMWCQSGTLGRIRSTDNFFEGMLNASTGRTF